MTAITHDPLTGTRWQLDPKHSTAEFHVRTYWGLTTVHGCFQRLEGTIGPDGQMELTLEAASLETHNQRRDKHLRSEDFFDTAHHPHIHFRSTRIEPQDDGELRVAGELHAAGRKIRIDLQPVIRRIDDHQLELTAQTMIDQRQLGMTYHRFGIRAPSTVTVHARLHAVSEARTHDGLPRAELEGRSSRLEDCS